MDIILEHDRLSANAYTPHAASGVYALIFDKNNQAIQVTSSPFVFAAFDGPTQTNFAIELPEHSERTRHYTKTLTESQITLPDNDYGESYKIEIWYKEVSGSVFDRTVDRLVEVQKLNRFGGESVDSMLSEAQEDAIRDKVTESLDNYEVFQSVVWDHINSLFSITCFLELNGELITDPSSATFTMYDDEENVVVNADMGTPNAAGAFFKTVSGVTLNPDRAYFSKTTIVEADEETEHTGGSSPLTWD
jgi:hypothetical protein